MGKSKKFNDQPFAYHAEIELEIATLTNLGSGLGRVALPGDPEAKWVVMVPFTLPGERVRVRVFRNHKNFSEADLVEVLTPSPHRVGPACPLFARCGGCQYQHLAYAEQLAWKQRQVAELLQHMAGIEFPVSPVVASPRELGYRSKITPHFNPPREPAVPPPIGFLRQGTRFDIVDVPHCPIATDAINAKLPEVRARVHARAAAGEYQRAATLLLREASGTVTTDYDAVITETVAGASSAGAGPGSPPPAATAPLRLKFLARDFFQNNPFILPAFVAYVREQARARFGYLMPGQTSYVVIGADGKPLAAQATLGDPRTTTAGQTPTAWWTTEWKSVQLAGDPPPVKPKQQPLKYLGGNGR